VAVLVNLSRIKFDAKAKTCSGGSRQANALAVGESPPERGSKLTHSVTAKVTSPAAEGSAARPAPPPSL
jgi:hypothetical protein